MIMKELEPGYVFDTVFWIDKSPDGKPRYSANLVNSKPSPRRITTLDRRAVPGQRCKVRVEELRAEEIVVTFLGLVDFSLDDDIYVEPVMLEQFEILLASGRSILLDGPQGTGKTTISRALAKSLGMEYVFFNCSICFEPSDFAGSLQLSVGDDGQARTLWVRTDVLSAVYEANEKPEKRYLVFLDELNRCRSFALNGIMSAIDSSRRIFDPQCNRYVVIPENVQWIAAINNGRQFSGTYRIDVAQLDRFSILKLDYPPEEEEIRILALRYPQVDRKRIRKVVSVARVLRSDSAIQTDLSMRATDEACMFLSYPINLRNHEPDRMVKILATSYCNRLPGALTEEGSEAQVAYSLIERNVLLEKAL